MLGTLRVVGGFLLCTCQVTDHGPACCLLAENDDLAPGFVLPEMVGVTKFVGRGFSAITTEHVLDGQAAALCLRTVTHTMGASGSVCSLRNNVLECASR